MPTVSQITKIMRIWSTNARFFEKKTGWVTRPYPSAPSWRCSFKPILSEIKRQCTFSVFLTKNWSPIQIVSKFKQIVSNLRQILSKFRQIVSRLRQINSKLRQIISKFRQIVPKLRRTSSENLLLVVLPCCRAGKNWSPSTKSWLQFLVEFVDFFSL